MRQSTAIADALNKAFYENKSEAQSRYEAAVAKCDEAWRGVEGALSNDPFRIGIWVEAQIEYRSAYALKCAAWFRWKGGN